MEYLTARDILKIHSFIIDETGGSHGVRDRGVIDSVVQTPKQPFGGQEVYPDIYQKAAVYMHRIIMNHPFVDGNKRTAVTATSVFLEENGHNVTVKEGGFELYAVRVVEEKLEVEDIAVWLEENTKKVD